MTDKPQMIVFGEVLFDCFPGGEQVLGGAPFNVAWHLQALGDQPRFVSRVGDDAMGKKILDAMQGWGMDTSAVQIDPVHPTGHVQIEMADGEPHYTITPEVAYDFIEAAAVPSMEDGGMLYHGSLALRHSVSRDAFTALAGHPARDLFIDINLRPPWWRQEEVAGWLAQARWAKMNEHELRDLGFASTDVKTNMSNLQSRYGMEQLIVTRGKEGVLVRAGDGAFHAVPPGELERRVDTVGAGDAFSGVCLHGLRSGWPLQDILERARDFAEKVIGIRGATPSDPDFYKDYV